MSHIILIILGFLSIACTTIKKPFLYEVSKGNEKAYLFGTIHLGVPVQDLPIEVMSKFQQATVVGFEVDPKAEATSPKYDEKAILKITTNQLELAANALTEVTKRFSREKGQPISKSNILVPKPNRSFGKRFNDENWNYLVKSELGMLFADPAAEDALPPELIYHYLTAKLKREVEVSRTQHSRMNLRFSMDANLMDLAKENKAQLIVLDDEESLPKSCLDLMYNKMIADYVTRSEDKVLAEFDELVSAYRSGEEEKIASLDKSQDPTTSKCLLEDRNLIWLPKLTAELGDMEVNKRPPPFIAVGVAHLVGDKNLLDLLRARGYSVQRVVTGQ